MDLQQENSHKNDDFVKIFKKLTFFLKNRLTVNNLVTILKNCLKIAENMGPLKKVFVY